MRSGWLCPKCQKVHAPWVPSCTCHMVALPVAPTTPIRNDGQPRLPLCGCVVGTVCGNSACPYLATTTSKATTA